MKAPNVIRNTCIYLPFHTKMAAVKWVYCKGECRHYIIEWCAFVCVRFCVRVGERQAGRKRCVRDCEPNGQELRFTAHFGRHVVGGQREWVEKVEDESEEF